MSGAMSGHLLQARFLQRWHCLRWQPFILLAYQKNIPKNQCHLQILILNLSHGRSYCAAPCNCCIRPLSALSTLNKACHRSSTVSTQVLWVFSQSDKLKNICLCPHWSSHILTNLKSHFCAQNLTNDFVLPHNLTTPENTSALPGLARWLHHWSYQHQLEMLICCSK